VTERTRGTKTSNFGVSKRENHDATAFYARFSPPEVSDDDTVAAPSFFDRIVVGDSRHMAEVADNSVALVVTSPPYFAGKAYEEALGEGAIPATYLEYLEMLRDVFAECVRVLEPGGRIAVNVANLGRRPYRSLAADITAILQDDLRLLLRGEVVWVKQRGASGSCAWGSFQRPGNPVLRDVSERVIVAAKGRFDRAVPAPKRAKLGLPSVSSITRDEFMEATLDVWELPAESASRVGHPAPFPVALPERLIHLYTYVGDVVLDPFMGSGSTAVAAVRTGRHFVGYDTDPAYVAAATDRALAERATATQTSGTSTVALPPARPPPSTRSRPGLQRATWPVSPSPTPGSPTSSTTRRWCPVCSRPSGPRPPAAPCGGSKWRVVAPVPGRVCSGWRCCGAPSPKARW
jgi:site-specific DNA-methyltransferase (adenine-specific)